MVAEYFLIPRSLNSTSLPPSPYLLIAKMLEFSLLVQSSLAGLRDLRKTNPALHEALMQTSVTDLSAVDAEEEAYTTREVDDNCDIPLDVVDDGGIARSGTAEASDAEDDEGLVDAAPPVLGRGQRKEIAALRYLGPVWEGH
ncbi:hypothetical protein C8R45DRAFT_1110853 [Mycena sanguinolenta]|nr:hypothetical protein C8R45DRAFT_1110853 [Mycena sanguinolenta]